MGFDTSDCLARPRDPEILFHDNCGISGHRRTSGIHISKLVRVTGGPGTLVASILRWTGCVLIMEQYAEIISVTSLVNATDVYADIYDQTVATKLTSGNPGGAVLSGCAVGSFFTADEDDTNPYTVLNANQARKKSSDRKNIGYPFYINAKPAVDNDIRFHLTTTDNPLDFEMMVHFAYRPMDGSTLEFL